MTSIAVDSNENNPKSTLSRLNLNIIGGLVVALSLFHGVVTDLQCRAISRAIHSIPAPSIEGSQTVEINIPMKGGLCFPRPICRGVMVRHGAGMKNVDIRFIDSDSPLLAPHDVSFQYQVVMILMVPTLLILILINRVGFMVSGFFGFIVGLWSVLTLVICLGIGLVFYIV